MIKKLLVLMLFVILMSNEVFAMTAPGAGSSFKFISDLVVNDVVQGPIGYSLAVLSAIFSAGMVIMSKLLPAIGGIVGTALLVGAPRIVESAGVLII